jgi:hypothetical protein
MLGKLVFIGAVIVAVVLFPVQTGAMLQWVGAAVQAIGRWFGSVI